MLPVRGLQRAARTTPSSALYEQTGFVPQRELLRNEGEARVPYGARLYG
jgi:hypothetical protein